jgi:hypothetical protein
MQLQLEKGPFSGWKTYDFEIAKPRAYVKDIEYKNYS